MSDIGTHKQKVDQERYNEGYDGVYRRPKARKQGKTVYVCRNGKVVPKSNDSPAFIELPAAPTDEYTATLDRLKQDVVALYVPKTILHTGKNGDKGTPVSASAR